MQATKLTQPTGKPVQMLGPTGQQARVRTVHFKSRKTRATGRPTGQVLGMWFKAGEVDKALRATTGTGLFDWLAQNRFGNTYPTLAAKIEELTGLTISGPTVGAWCRRLGINSNKRGTRAA